METNPELWYEFRKVWPLERVRKMALSEYTDAGSKETFTYWVESRLDSLGSIWGGSAHKFGIYSRRDTSEKEGVGNRMYSDKYGWLSKYGESPEEAFENVRAQIVKTIMAVQKGDLDIVEKVDLGNSYKFKIAFHYQPDLENPVCLNIFDRHALSYLSGLSTRSPLSEMYTEILKGWDRKDILSFTKNLWFKWDEYKKGQEKKCWFSYVYKDQQLPVCIENSFLMMQYQYGVQPTNKVTEHLNSIIKVRAGDLILLVSRERGVIVSWGVACTPRLDAENTDKLSSVISEKAHKYSEGIIHFEDAECFYENLSDHNGMSEPWGQRIDVEKWNDVNFEGIKMSEGLGFAKIGSSRASFVQIKKNFFEKAKALLQGRAVVDSGELYDGHTVGNSYVNRTFSLNTILYGPPGTGKTYITRRKTASATYIGVSKKVFDELEEFIFQNGDEASRFLQPSYSRTLGKTLKAQQYVGVIEIRNRVVIEILPKIAGITEETNYRLTFLKMLRQLRHSPFYHFDYAHLKCDTMHLLEIFIAMFCNELAQLVQRGIRFDYITRKENSKYLRGRLRITEHIRYNGIHKERFFVEYDDYCPDRMENRIIRTTIEFLYKRSTSGRNKKRLREFLFVFDDIAPVCDIKSAFNTIKTDRLMGDYKQVLMLCRIFLNNESFTSFKGRSIAFALLFDMNRVFEDYVAYCLKRDYPHIEIKTQVCTEHLIYYPKREFVLKPDLKIGTAIIADTKWKILDTLSNHSGIIQSDLYQVFAYGKKYKGIKEIHLIYPETEKFPDKRYYRFDSGLCLRLFPFDCCEGIIEGYDKLEFSVLNND